MAVKIIIRRKVPKNKEAQLLPLLLELRSKATTQPGYISGETLRNVNEPEDYVVISTWKSVEDWKKWEGNKGRRETLSKIEALLGEKAAYGIYLYG
jgi:heme-degrading monooxygenase HmoA